MKFLTKFAKGTKRDVKKFVADIRNANYLSRFPISYNFGEKLKAVTPCAVAGYLHNIEF